MKIIVLGAAGFIGTNLILKLSQDPANEITAVDKDANYFSDLKSLDIKGLQYKVCQFDQDSNYEELLHGQDIVYHLVSSTMPSNSNQHIPQEITSNIVVSSLIFEACVKENIKRVIFISSGGTVYGKITKCPIPEDTITYPISSYGVQKITIEKLLYLYKYMYGLDYRVVRLANPYGPYQRPNGKLGVITTFTYKALNKEKINVYGDGSVIRDFIYIDDAVNAIVTLANNECKYSTYNIGSGKGTSVNEALKVIETALGVELAINHTESRPVDVPTNYLDVSRYEKEFGKICNCGLYEGIKRTAIFMREHYNIK